jgi:hypothetical protein
MPEAALPAKPGTSCVQPARGPIAAEPESGNGAASAPVQQKETAKVLARVGKPAPDFEANAFHEGGFKNVKLSDYKGQWVVLCFYPGDFTFV